MARIPAWVVGEFLGTFVLVFFGCGSVAAAVLTGAQVGIFKVAIVWGLGIATAIYLTENLSGAHLNPAVTITLAAWRGFPVGRIPGYILAQCGGAFAASAVLYVFFSGLLSAFESLQGLSRGTPGSEASAMIFGEFYPNPGGRPLIEPAKAAISTPTAFLIEAFGTGLLLLVILAITNPRNSSRPSSFAPLTVGLTVTILISLLGPLTMAGLNPARDFAPRVFSAIAGWGSVPFTANGSGWLWVYIVAPIAGGLVGGAVYHFFLRPHYEAASSNATP